MVKVAAAVFVMLVVMLQSARADSPGLLEKALAADAARFTALAEDVIAGFGGPEGLTRSGIDDHVALDRAAARAGAMRRFLGMDLDNDGAVTRAEHAVSLRAASASARGRLERLFTATDKNADDRISAEEMRLGAAAAGLRAVTPQEEATLHALMALDGDANGALTLDELRAALVRLDPAT